MRRITFIFPFNPFHAAQSYSLPAPPCFNRLLQINTCNSRDGSSRLLSYLLHSLSPRGRQTDPLQHGCSEGNVVPLSRCRSSRYQRRRSANHSYQCTHASDCVYNSRCCRRRGNRSPLRDCCPGVRIRQYDYPAADSEEHDEPVSVVQRHGSCLQRYANDANAVHSPHTLPLHLQTAAGYLSARVSRREGSLPHGLSGPRQAM